MENHWYNEIQKNNPSGDSSIRYKNNSDMGCSGWYYNNPWGEKRHNYNPSEWQFESSCKIVINKNLKITYSKSGTNGHTQVSIINFPISKNRYCRAYGWESGFNFDE